MTEQNNINNGEKKKGWWETERKITIKLSSPNFLFSPLIFLSSDTQKEMGKIF